MKQCPNQHGLVHARARSFALISACAAFWVVESTAQSFPVKPVRLVVGLVAGGAADVTARLVGQKLAEQFGQPVIVENRPGAGGAIATERVASAPPDGYNLLVLTSSATVLPALHAKLPFDMERDLAPVSLMTSGPWLLVAHPSVPAANAREFIALARSQPGRLNYGSSGVGGATHLAGEYFNQMAKVKISHVPYKGGAESAVAVAGGQVDITYSSIPSVLPLLEARKLKPLAATSAKRASLLPQVPTLAESGLSGFDYTIWVGVLVRAGTAKEIVSRLNTSIAQIVNTAEMKATLNKQGLEPQSNTPEQFAALIHREIEQNTRLVKLIGIKPE